MVRGQMLRILMVAAAVATLLIGCTEADSAAEGESASVATAEEATEVSADAEGPESESTESEAEESERQSEGGALEEVTGEFNVVLVAPETGALAATAGAAVQAGTEAITALWNEDHPDRPVRVTTCNDESNPERAISCVNRFAGEADVMIGPLFGALYAASEELMGQEQIALTFTPHALPGPDTGIFQAATPASLAMERSIDYMEEQGWDRFGFLTSTDTTGNTAREAGLAAAEAAGIEVVDQQFDPEIQDLTAQASTIASADVDAVFVWSSGAQVVTALRGLAAAGVEVPVFLNFSSMSYQLLDLAADVLPEELLFTGSGAFDPASIEDAERRELIERFTEAYTASADIPPDWIGFATADMFQVGMSAALVAEDREGMLQALEEGPEIPGFHAVWDYSPEDHVGVSESGESPIVIQRWTGDGWETAQ